MLDQYFTDDLKDRADMVRRFMLLVSSVIVLVLTVAGQEPPKAILVDEFSKLTCEDVISRQDNLFAELQKSPNSVGYAIIFTDKENQKQALRMEMMFHGQTEFRKFDNLRFSVVRPVATEGLRIQLWIIPPDARLPELQPTEWGPEMEVARKPFKFNASEYDRGPCPIGSQFKIYSDYLSANPNARGHIVIWAKTSAQFRKEKGRIRGDFLTKYNVGASRVRFFYFRHRSPYIKWEYWIVPNRNT